MKFYIHIYLNFSNSDWMTNIRFKQRLKRFRKIIDKYERWKSNKNRTSQKI